MTADDKSIPGYAQGFEAVDRAIATFLEDPEWQQGGLGIEDKRRRMRAVVAVLPATAVMEDWQDISIAPKDGSGVLVWEQYINDKFHPAEVARFKDGRWTNSSNRLVPNVPHWKPLGSPPTIPAKPAQEGQGS